MTIGDFLRRTLPPAALALGLGCLGLGLAATAAQAQAIVAFINGNPITSFDVEQRMKINGALGKRGGGRQEAIRDLVDDKLKIIEARRIGYRLSDDNVDEQMARIARSNNQTSLEFMQNLSRTGIDSNAYREKLKADYSWELAVAHKFKGSSIGDTSEVEQTMQTRLKEGAAKVTDFVVHSVIFVVPRTGEGAGAREREANAARARFTDCTSGLEAIRHLRDVAVKPPVKRSSDQISPQLNALLSKTPVNRMSPPFKTEQGIEMVAVCEKIEREDRTGLRAKAENEVSAKKRGAETQAYLKSLRDTAVIQYR